MKKILVTTAIVGFAFANTYAQAPASVGTTKAPAGVHSTDPAKPAAKPAHHQATPAPAGKETPAAVGTEKQVHVIQATDPSKEGSKNETAKPAVQQTPPANATPASVNTDKKESSSGKKKENQDQSKKQETPAPEKKNQ